MFFTRGSGFFTPQDLCSTPPNRENFTLVGFSNGESGYASIPLSVIRRAVSPFHWDRPMDRPFCAYAIQALALSLLTCQTTLSVSFVPTARVRARAQGWGSQSCRPWWSNWAVALASQALPLRAAPSVSGFLWPEEKKYQRQHARINSRPLCGAAWHM